MIVKKIKKNEIARLLADWKSDFTVFVPARELDIYSRMAEWDGKDTGFLERYRNTAVPCKALFLPPVEEMFRFVKTAGGHNFDLPPAEKKKRLIFGIRPCDARALKMLDEVFEDTYEDPYYLPKRENTLLVGIGCTSPYDSCFCTSLNGDPFGSEGLDLLLIDIGKEYLIEVASDAGSELLEKCKYANEANATDEEKARDVKKHSREEITKRLDTERIRNTLKEIFEDEDYWRETAAKCISCGVCTLLCPTCYCFDINDEISRGRGHRLRSPDSCSFAEYTKMPMENPREEKWRRLRNKVCHKYVFHPMNFGAPACTGCGRCIRLCPVNWDISKVLSELPAKA